jgi:holin-like protein
MVEGIAILLMCQLIGVFIVEAFSVSIPGPVLGMALLAVALLIMKRIPQRLEKSADGLLSHLSLLFVPAAVGVVQQFDLIQREGIAILVALAISTTLSIAVCGLVFSLVSKKMVQNTAHDKGRD